MSPVTMKKKREETDKGKTKAQCFHSINPHRKNRNPLSPIFTLLLDTLADNAGDSSLWDTNLRCLYAHNSHHL